MQTISTAATGSQVAQYATLGAYLAVMVAIAFVCRRKNTSINDFLLANRGVNGWLTAFAYGATYFSAVIFVGYAGQFGWKWGLAAVWIGVSNAIFGTFVAWKVLARRTKIMSNNLDAKTMPDFFAKRYGDLRLKLLASVIIFVFLVPYSSSVYQGLGHIFQLVFGLDFIWCIVILACVSAVYLFFGGYFASSISDFFQGIIMIIGVTVMIFYLFASPEVNWSEGIATLTQNGLGIIPSAGTDLLSSPLFNVIIMVLLTSFGIWALPQSIHKFYAIKDQKAIRRGTVISTVFSLIVGGGAYLEGSLVTLFISSGEFVAYDQLVPAMINKALPGALLGLIVVLLLSASISTLSSLSLTSASTVSVDFFKAYLKRDATEKQVSVLMRVLCVVFVVISAVLAALQLDAIVTMMSLSWGVIAGCFIGPYVLGLYSKKVTAAGAWASMIGCLVLTLTLILLFGFLYPSQAEGLSPAAAVLKGGIGKSPLIGVCSMIFSFIITPIVSRFTKKPDEPLLQTSFSGINATDFEKSAAEQSATATLESNCEYEQNDGASTDEEAANDMETAVENLMQAENTETSTPTEESKENDNE